MAAKNTDIAGILRAAWAAVEEAEVPEALRPLAFEKAVDLLCGAATPQLGHPGGLREGRAEGGGDAGSDDGTAIGRLAAKLTLDAETVAEVFHHDGDDLRLVVGPSKFETQKRAATMKIALLIAAALQGSGKEEWTPVATLRDVVKDFNRFDSGNFATTIGKMDDVFLFSGAKASERKVKVNRQGYETATELVKSLTGGGDS